MSSSEDLKVKGNNSLLSKRARNSLTKSKALGEVEKEVFREEVAKAMEVQQEAEDSHHNALHVVSMIIYNDNASNESLTSMLSIILKRNSDQISTFRMKKETST